MKRTITWILNIGKYDLWNLEEYCWSFSLVLLSDIAIFLIWRKEGNVLFNNSLNTFYLWLYGIWIIKKEGNILFNNTLNTTYLLIIMHVLELIGRPGKDCTSINTFALKNILWQVIWCKIQITIREPWLLSVLLLVNW